MSFELFLSALSPLANNGFNELEKYTEREAYITATLSPKYEAIILKELLDQPYIHNPEYSIFQYDIQKHTLELITSFIEKNSIYPINFQIADKNVIVNCLSILSLGTFLINSDNRYVFLPVNYESEVKKGGHRATLVIDNKDNNVYLLEPNGRPSYFNTLVSNSEAAIESFYEQYFDMINSMFQTKYKYIKTHIWNHKNIVLNNTSNVKLSNGDCMILSMILCQLIKNLEMTPEVMYQKFKSMSDDECVSLIRSYSMGLIRYVRATKRDKVVDKIDGLYNVYILLKDGMSNIKSFYEFNHYLREMKGKLPEFYKELLTAHKIFI